MTMLPVWTMPQMGDLSKQQRGCSQDLSCSYYSKGDLTDLSWTFGLFDLFLERCSNFTGSSPPPHASNDLVVLSLYSRNNFCWCLKPCIGWGRGFNQLARLWWCWWWLCLLKKDWQWWKGGIELKLGKPHLSLIGGSQDLEIVASATPRVAALPARKFEPSSRYKIFRRIETSGKENFHHLNGKRKRSNHYGSHHGVQKDWVCERLVTFEIFDQSDGETCPDPQIPSPNSPNSNNSPRNYSCFTFHFL